MGARIKKLLAENKLVRVFCAGQLCSPKLVEIIGFQGGYDAVWLDQEHVGLTIPQIEDAARAARGVGLDSFVRLTATDYATVMRPLEAGAGGVMASMIPNSRFMSFSRSAPPSISCMPPMPGIMPSTLPKGPRRRV